MSSGGLRTNADKAAREAKAARRALSSGAGPGPGTAPSSGGKVWACREAAVAHPEAEVAWNIRQEVLGR